ncbi:MAG TPA: hypothetical protein VF686_04975 [Brevundimonas sp.]
MKRILSALLACAVALPALAQDASADWDLMTDQRRRLTVAYTRFDNGVTVATRCADGGFETIVTGLPPAGAATRRTLRIAFGDDDLFDSQWSVATDDTVAVADLPAPFARRMRAGGRLRILVPNGATEGRNLLYDLQLPASSGAIDQTLTSCGRPLVDPRDAELNALPDDGVPGTIAWAVRPRPQYPETRYARGFAVITCLTNPDGSLRDCAIESEHPHDGRFGRPTLASARRARLQNIAEPGAPVPAAQVLYKVNYVMDGYQTREEERARRPARG